MAGADLTNAIKLQARMKTRDGNEIAHACEFTSEDWELLREFAELAERLSQSRLLKQPWGGLEFSVTYDDNGSHVTKSNLPDLEDFDACLLRMRPFVLKSSRLHFGKIRKLLAKALPHPEFQRYLKRQKEIFNGARQPVQVVSDGTQLNSPNTVDELWLIAYKYHEEEKGKRDKLDALLQGHPMKRGLSEVLFIDLMLDRARAIMDVGNAIYCLQRDRVITPFPGDIPPQA